MTSTLWRSARLKRVVLVHCGAGGTTGSDEVTLVCDLAARFPNICGVMMDDFFRKPDNTIGLGVFGPEENRSNQEPACRGWTKTGSLGGALQPSLRLFCGQSTLTSAMW